MNLLDIILRPVAVDEEPRFKALLDAHHYLGAVAKIGHTLWYVATWQGKWLALLVISAAAWKGAARDRWIGWDQRYHYDRGLCALHVAQEELTQRHAEDHLTLDAERRAAILALASDFPRLWHDPQTTPRERKRKRMVRLLLEDVTLTKGETIAVGVRFRGGATR